MGGSVEGDDDAWNGRMGRGRLVRLGWEDGRGRRGCLGGEDG